MAFKASKFTLIGASDAVYPAQWDNATRATTGITTTDSSPKASRRIGVIVSGEPTTNSWPHLVVETFFWTYRGGWRHKNLEWIAIAPEDIAEAWAMVTVSSPVSKHYASTYSWGATPAGTSYYHGGRDEYLNAVEVETISTTVSAAMCLAAVRIDGSGDPYRVIVSSLGTAASYEDGVPTKTDMTNFVKAYLANKGSCYCFETFLVPGAGVDLITPEPDDLETTLDQINAAYWSGDGGLSYEYDPYTGVDYAFDYWATGSTWHEYIEWSGISIGTIWLRLTNGITLAVTDRVMYRLPPNFQPVA